MSRTVSLACASAILLALAAPAAVAQQQFHQERTVRTSDIDINTRRGADEALERIEEASEQLCGDRPGPMPLPERAGVENCTYETMEIAVADSGNRMLHQRYYGYEPQVIIEDDGSADPYLEPKGSR
ncbi:MAG: UrcA family protein [Hyphomonadaceae bacterium]|nr:UrcA family protein [Hyphomonadaceae bacterium]